jgi:hypothetical protein
MFWKTTALIAAAALAMGAAPAAKPAASKPAAGKPAATAKPAAKPSQQGPFDARDPASLIAMLGGMDAKAEVARAADDAVFLKVTTPAYAFAVQYAGCDAQKRGCKALAFTTQSDKRTATVASLNSFNQTSITCRVWQDNQGKPHVMYSALLTPGLSREDMRLHLGAWQGCLANFGEFLSDPAGYLAAAP